jgi:hypothetical protein
MTITADQLTPGTRFRGNAQNNVNGICIVEAQPDIHTQGLSQEPCCRGPEWVWARAEDPVRANRQGLIFHIDEIGEIL